MKKIITFLVFVHCGTALKLFPEIHRDDEAVTVYVNHHQSRTRRSDFATPDGDPFQDTMSFSFDIEGQQYTWNLKKNRLLERQVPVVLVTNGKFKPVLDNTKQSDYAFYQLREENRAASVLVRCPGMKKPCQLHGHVSVGAKHYVVEGTDGVLKGKLLSSVPHKIKQVNQWQNFTGDATRVKINITDPDSVVERQEATEEKTREKRQARIRHVVEVEMVIDYTIYDYWLSISAGNDNVARDAIEQYYQLVANNMDLRYQSVKEQSSTISVSVVPLRILVDLTSSWIRGNSRLVQSVLQVEAEKAMYAFRNWTVQNRQQLTNYDHIMAFTRGDLGFYDTTGLFYSGSAGIALTNSQNFVSLVCRSQTNSVSLIEDRTAGDSSSVAAHELGHSLGLPHDDVFSQADCSKEAQYIMASARDVRAMTSAKAPNPWRFSRCSVQGLEQALNGIQCTQNHSFSETQYNLIMNLEQPGKVYDVNTQCRLAYGEGSYMCFELSESICWADMYCRDPKDTSGSCYSVHVMSGTPCAEGKWCYRGECVQQPTTITTKPTNISTSRTTSVQSTTARTGTGTNVTTATTTRIPSTTKTSTTIRIPTTIQTSTTTRIPTTIKTSTTTRIPSTTKTSTTSRIPSTTKTSTTIRIPTTIKTSTTTRIPSTTKTSTTTRIPSTSTQTPPCDLWCRIQNWYRNNLG
ncbi:hypothetical protein ACJMK2_002194 [Sinanodonta woodiana]|uniref:Peptidase M12B domain-containing protein n=1 Tax=Sinanodonta woodiana TaxID=1069815 RepID=A0ABD3XV37_SINWO